MSCMFVHTNVVHRVHPDWAIFSSVLFWNILYIFLMESASCGALWLRDYTEIGKKWVKALLICRCYYSFYSSLPGLILATGKEFPELSVLPKNGTSGIQNMERGFTPRV